MHFVIMGGAGFIGSHVTEQLLAEGHAVTVVDNLLTGNLHNLPCHPQLRFLQRDLFACQPHDFIKPIDGIVHLAATPSVTQSWLNPLDVHRNNLSTTVALIQLCEALKISRLVFASSAAVYGANIQLPISEEQEANPISPYGLQKLVSEYYINLFARQFNLSCISLRLFNVFGPRQVPDSPYSGVISIFTEAMRQGTPITIYGDGQQTRDFIYVKDVARAFVQALTVPLPAGSTLSCNVGTGQKTSLIKLIHILKDYFPNWKPNIQFANVRPGDIQHSQANISRIMALLEFTPRWSVQSGLRILAESIAHIVSY
jgi:UDP-glucose 4-epimerase